MGNALGGNDQGGDRGGGMTRGKSPDTGVDLQLGNNSSLCRLGPGFMRRVRHFGDLEMAT